MLSYVYFGTNDLEKATLFYDVVDRGRYGRSYRILVQPNGCSLNS
jgi:hypothetical protein